MTEFEFKWEVLGMGYEMSKCKCETVACMVFEERVEDKLITTVFTKDNLSLKKSTVTQQTIVLTENNEQLFDPKKLKPLEKPAKREIEDIFGEDDWDTVANYLGMTRLELIESFKDNYDDINKKVVETLFRKDLMKSSKETLSRSFDRVTTQVFGMTA